MTALPGLEPCAHCGHPQGDHRSTAGTAFSLHPVRHGRCQVGGCDCGEWKPSSDQSESRALTLLRGFALRIEDNSRGSFSDEAAHRFLAAINEECRKMLAALDRPDLLAEFALDEQEQRG